jgi:putative tryptophan/tyrosine transport system substrate-binding protein
VITRRSVLLAGGISLLVAHRLSHGQPTATIRRVGVLSLGSESLGAPFRMALAQGMRDLGWVEGKNVEYRLAYANSDLHRLGALANELLVQKVEVIVVGSTQATVAAQRATKTTPIVMIAVSNVVGAGFVESLAKPGGNITGIVSQTEVLLGKVIEILHEVLPRARRIAILLNESNPSHPVFWTVAQSTCAALGLVALRVVASAPTQLGAAVEQIVRQQSEAVVVIADALYVTERAKLQELMQTTRLPVAYQRRDHAGCSATHLTSTRTIATPRSTSIRYSRAQTPVTCPSISRPSSSW